MRLELQLFGIMLTIPLSVFGALTAKSDSVVKEPEVTDLQELVVNADNAYFKDGVLTVIPSSREKAAALDGNELLRFMQIPTLVYDHVSKKIKHIDGVLAMFINGEPATEQEIQSLKTDDVTRVEYMDFPSDPRYRQAPHVVNFVVMKYLYGGYARAKSEESLVRFSNFSTLYSKFSIKDLTFDMSAQYLGSISHFDRDESSITYRFNDEVGNPSYLKEETKLDHDIRKSNYVPVYLRVKYSRPTYIISNTIGYKFSGNPVESIFFNTEYSGIYNDRTSSCSKTRSHSNDVMWSGDYTFFLPKNWYLQIYPYFSHTHNNHKSISNSGIEGLDEVLYGNRENSYQAGYTVNVNKRIKNKHSLYITAAGTHAWFNINYDGSTVTNTKKKYLLMSYVLGYYFTTSKFSAGVSAGYVYNRTSQDGIVRSEGSPSFGLHTYFTPTRKHTFSFQASYYNVNLGPKQTSSEIIKVNDFMYVTGDPDAKETKYVKGSLSWSWLPSNLFRIGLSAMYDGQFGRLVPEYLPYANGTAILQKNGNNGNQQNLNIFANFGIHNIANCISLTLSPFLCYYHETGIYARRLLAFNYRASIDCLLGNGISLFASYSGPQKRYDSGTTTRICPSYSIGARCNWRNLSVDLNLRNIFGGTDWGVKKSFVTDYYSISNLTAYEENYQVNITLTYTFSYGKKKIDHDELRSLSGAGSGAIGF